MERSLACRLFGVPALLAVAVLAVVGSGPARASDGRPPTSYYLALGDAVGVSPGVRSYPYLLRAQYEDKLRGLRLKDIAVSGETTTSMLQGGQYVRAGRFLRAHKGHIALITIDIGGNDIVGCVTPNGVSPNSPCAEGARAMIRRNLGKVLAGLHAAAPGVPVIGMSYYDPFLGDWLAGGAYRSLALSTLPGLLTLNRELTSLYGGTNNTADVQHAFRSTDFKTAVASSWGRIPIAVQRACAWLNTRCHQGAPERFGDVPNDAGAAAISSAFEHKVDRLCVRRSSAVFRRC